ncbi:MAG: 5'/3'-nucleotidase SurE [Schwartzia sp.]|nr:5'/3'-nucleotidase SurE [Schwartzia sp. (in: firmicutes)]
MRILLSNDDGIDSVGMAALVEALAPEHTLVVAAPATEQSAKAHAITVRTNIEVEPGEHFAAAGIEAWKIHGTPADCVKLYLEAMARPETMPELVISGINKGANLGSDVLYSGTVGAAIEGYMHGLPAIAVSLDIDSVLPYTQVAALFRDYLPALFAEAARPFLFNINYPRFLLDGVPNYVFTSVGRRDYLNAFQRIEINGRVYYHMAGEIYDGPNDEVTDVYAANHGYIAVSPLRIDLTDVDFLDEKLRYR